MEKARSRFVRAACVLGVLVATAGLLSGPVMGFLIGGGAVGVFETGFASKTYMGGIWRSVVNGGSLQQGMLDAGLLSIESQSDLPQWVLDEVVGTDGKREMYANEEFSVIGFVLDGDRDSAMGKALTEISSKGWVSYGESSANVVSLSKQEGDCRWLMVECVEFEGEASVVLRIARD